MSDADTMAELMDLGALRPSDAASMTCAAEPCDTDCAWQVVHTPDDDRIWVPMCERHLSALLAGERIEYELVISGFIQ